nr:retrovirus-related Pol polyprotein from transposon TNT 1-94 [Tanacetum cinerariifolium]
KKNQEGTCRLHQLNGDVIHNQPTSSSFNEEIDVIAITNDLLPLSIENDDSDKEVDAVDVLRVDKFIQNSEHEYSESEDSDFDNPPVLLPPLEPPDKEFNFKIAVGNEISIMFSLLSAKSEDTIFDPGLWYPKGSSFGLKAFSNVDHAGCIDSRKSTSRGIQFLSDKLVSWMSKKQDCTAMSSEKAEYVALSASCAQVITEYQLADMFTKALPEDRFKYLIRRIGMRCWTPAELEVLAKESA